MAPQVSSREHHDVVQILLVDDQPRNLETLEAMLDGADLRLVRASSADEALLALLQEQFAAIVLDIRMPGTSGFELATFIKQRKRTQHVPILFLTAHMADEQEILRGYSTGAVDYLTKPIRPEILRSKISVFVELYRKTQALERAKDALEREVAERERAEEGLRQNNLELERRVAERTEALEAADRRKDEFLAALAHELRNPLAPIRAAVEVMRLKGTADAQIENARGVVDRQVEHMTRLIDDLLDLSRITRDRLVLRTSRVQLADVVAAAVETSRPIIEQRGHTLSVDVPNRPVWIEADPARLAQVLSNLLTNAAKYTAHGGRIGIETRVDDREVIIGITDNGIGIPADMLPRIFEMFMQVDRTRGRAGDGLGIGLTLARRLIEMHGGAIDARSEGAGLGSEFSVRLPLPVALEDNLDEIDLVELLPELPHALKVLVVDDNRDAAEMLASMLSAWAQDSVTAFDGPSAIELGARFQPDVVLLDLGMPKMDGYETARRIRALPWGQNCIIAAVTGWGQDADRERSRTAGFDHHLVKPVSPSALRTLLSRCRPISPRV
jgi:signal transduction histidine kinase